jgi:nucleoside-diphosphate-sugar epimerase
MSKILVTGGAGLLGRELCRQLKLLGNEVWVVDNHSRSNTIPDCDKFLEADLVDIETFRWLPNDFDYIYHYAAINGTTNFYNMPNQVLSKNFIADVHTFEFASTCKNIKRVIYASTSEIPVGESNPIPETVDVSIINIHNARWSYRLAKIAGENYLANSHIPHLMIRYYNVYGSDDMLGHFIPDQLAKIKLGIFEIVGGDETRSFCHVEDAIHASIYCAEKSKNGLVNIGSDVEITITDAANIIAQELGVQPNWTYIPSKAGSTKTRKPDLTTLRSIMPQFNPRPFEQGIKEILI